MRGCYEGGTGLGQWQRWSRLLLYCYSTDACHCCLHFLTFIIDYAVTPIDGTPNWKSLNINSSAFSCCWRRNWVTLIEILWTVLNALLCLVSWFRIRSSLLIFFWHLHKVSCCSEQCYHYLYVPCRLHIRTTVGRTMSVEENVVCSQIFRTTLHYTYLSSSIINGFTYTSVVTLVTWVWDQLKISSTAVEMTEY
jgi:hypothetical protein